MVAVHTAGFPFEAMYVSFGALENSMVYAYLPGKIQGFEGDAGKFADFKVNAVNAGCSGFLDLCFGNFYNTPHNGKFVHGISRLTIENGTPQPIRWSHGGIPGFQEGKYYFFRLRTARKANCLRTIKAIMMTSSAPLFTGTA